jgi:pimeloyl-ACP methyl ester carboxylesterase
MQVGEHYWKTKIRGYGSVISHAYWAVKPRNVAVVFVHGFAGDPLDTWLDFPWLTPRSQKFDGIDLIYFGYDGATARVTASATFLIRFLIDLATQPAQAIINPTMRPVDHRASPFKYEEIVLVGHSTGAILIREALLRCAKIPEAKTLLPRVRMVFFAPAHCGSELIPKNSDVLGGSLLVVLTQLAVNWRLPILKDLTRDGATIVNLRAATVKALKAPGLQSKSHLIAARIFFGLHEKVVCQDRFCEDPDPDSKDWVVFPDRDHVTVCKPRSLSDEPFTALLASIP